MKFEVILDVNCAFVASAWFISEYLVLHDVPGTAETSVPETTCRLLSIWY
jgi:hypothetical protein